MAWAYSDGRPAGGTDRKGAGGSGDSDGSGNRNGSGTRGGRLVSRLRRSGGSVEMEK